MDRMTKETIRNRQEEDACFPSFLGARRTAEKALMAPCNRAIRLRGMGGIMSITPSSSARMRTLRIIMHCFALLDGAKGLAPVTFH